MSDRDRVERDRIKQDIAHLTFILARECHDLKRLKRVQTYMAKHVTEVTAAQQRAREEGE